MVRVAVYLRVSTSDQSTRLQHDEIRSFLEARGWAKFTIYEDVGKSGRSDKRSSLQRLLSDARSRRFDIIICWKLDRFFRSLRHLVNLLQEFEDLGIQFIAIKDQIDMTTASGRLMLHIIGAMAEFEAALVRERVRSGLEAAKRAGTRLGRPRKRNDLRIQIMRSQGMSVRQIATRLAISPSTVSLALRCSNNPCAKRN